MRQFWELIEETLGPDFVSDRELQRDVLALSEALTTGREDLPADYINEPETQRAYLAYYVPLNFEKMRSILGSHAGVWPSKLPEKTMRWVDLGCGPGTAALAAIAAYKNRYKKEEKLPPIHIDLIDREVTALETAHALVTGFAEKIGVSVSIGMHSSLAAALNKAKGQSYDLSLAANVLNELPGEGNSKVREAMMQLWDATTGVMLILEPGHRVSSQRLVRFRERVLKENVANTRILGPCQHQENCPVNRTKHWCHFSEPVTDGRLVDLSLRIFKNPRTWLKFSYLLLKRDEPLPLWESRPEKKYRAIGDLHMSGPLNLAIDLCEPKVKFSLRVPRNIPPELRMTLVRGSVVTTDKARQVDARPMTKREPVKKLDHSERLAYYNERDAKAEAKAEALAELKSGKKRKPEGRPNVSLPNVRPNKVEVRVRKGQLPNVRPKK